MERGFQEYFSDVQRVLSPQEVRASIIFTPKQGENVIRILPRPGTIKFWWTMGWHYRLGYEGSQSFVCPMITLKERCPICERARELWESDSEEDNEVARALSAKTRYAMNIIDRADNNRIKLLIVGRNLFSLIVRLYKPSMLEKYDVDRIILVKLASVACDFTDPKSGKDILLEKLIVGKTAQEVEYSVSLANPSTVDDEVLQQLIDPMSVFPIYSYEDLQKALSGVELTPQKATYILNENRFRTDTSGGFQRVSQMTSQSPDTNISTQPVVVPAQPAVTSEQSAEQSVQSAERVPKCFGKEYEADDVVCKRCSFKDACKEVSSVNNAQTQQASAEETPSSDEEQLTPEDRIRKMLMDRRKR